MSLATVNNPKDIFVVNCQEIPEAVCVETRFVTRMVEKQKRNEYVFHVTNRNGSLELTRQEEQPAVLKNSTVMLGIPAKTGTSQLPSGLQNQTKSSTIMPLATGLTNLSSNERNNAESNSNILTNSAPGKSFNTMVAMPFNNTSQQQTITYNSNLPITANIFNDTNYRRTFNDQIQQTDVSGLSMKSIAIQCEITEMDSIEDEWTQVTEKSVENETSDEIADFLDFLKANSTQHSKHKECLICGEVCKSQKYFCGHMASHQGSQILCYKCGKFLDKQVLQFHNCRKVKQQEKAFLQCPHHSCGVVAISRLELFDHINEHNNNRMYKCFACRKGFCTAQEFLRHLLIRPNCYTSAKYKRFRVYGLESQRDRLCRVRVFTLHTFKECTTLVKSFLSQRITKKGKCKICLLSFSNRSLFNRHRVKCLMKFRKRLMRKRNRKECIKM